MKNVSKVVLATIALAGTTSAARADLTINGAVGLPLNPTAQIPEEGGARVQGNFYKLGNGVENYGILGAARVANNLEVNGGYTRIDGGNDRDGVALGAKYLFSRESDPAGVRFAVGAGYDHAFLKQTYVYGVATKYLGEVTGDRLPITAHAGVRYDKFKLISSNKVSVFAGVEVPIVADGSVQAVGEIQSKNVESGFGAKIPYSASVRYRPAGKPFGASVGVQRQGAGGTGFFAQVGYSFGRK
ncbi:hypothetical protein EON80_08395 [bacterium]|nr:MAG: hypothetical protein EON80_08395 [bacterium]